MDRSFTFAGGRAPMSLEVVRLKLRVRHYSLRTERAYVGWIRRFVMANGKQDQRLAARNSWRVCFAELNRGAGGVISPLDR